MLSTAFDRTHSEGPRVFPIKKIPVSLGFSGLHSGGRCSFTQILFRHFDLHWDNPAEFVIYGLIGHAQGLQNDVKIY
jgi:hypothetical protein